MFTQTRPALRRVADALSSPLPVDAYLGLLDPLWSSTSLKGRVVSVTPETHRSATITIYPGRGFGGYEAGQWVTVGVEIDGVRHRRCYSLTSNPERSEGLISITVSAMPEGLVSNHLVYGTEPGDYLTLEQPSGDFHLPADRTNPMLFITGGSGITPAMGMIRTLVGAEECHDVVLLHHAPDASETIFAAELAELDKRNPGPHRERRPHRRWCAAARAGPHRRTPRPGVPGLAQPHRMGLWPRADAGRRRDCVRLGPASPTASTSNASFPRRAPLPPVAKVAG
jgi:ferredoxin-NADP reductase